MNSQEKEKLIKLYARYGEGTAKESREIMKYIREEFWEAFTEDSEVQKLPWPVKHKWWRTNRHIVSACNRYKVFQSLWVAIKRSSLNGEKCQEILTGTKYDPSIISKETKGYPPIPVLLRRNFVSAMSTELDVSKITIKRLLAKFVKCRVIHTINLGGTKGTYYVIGTQKYQYSGAKLGFRWVKSPFLNSKTCNNLQSL